MKNKEIKHAHTRMAWEARRTLVTQALGRSSFSEEVDRKPTGLGQRKGRWGSRQSAFILQTALSRSLHVKVSRDGGREREACEGWRRLCSCRRAAVLKASQWERRGRS